MERERKRDGVVLLCWGHLMFVKIVVSPQWLFSVEKRWWLQVDGADEGVSEQLWYTTCPLSCCRRLGGDGILWRL